MFVYLITNNVNGKQYVGQHSGDNLGRYWNHNIADAQRGSEEKPCLYNAIRKYGVESFTIQPLVIVDSKWELDLYEKGLIKVLNTRRPVGYNLTDGGDGTVGLKHTERQRKLISKSLVGNKRALGTVHTPEFCQSISQRQKGRVYPSEFGRKISERLTGRKLSEETKKKISDAHKGKKISEGTRLNMSIAQKRRNEISGSPNKGIKQSQERIWHRVHHSHLKYHKLNPKCFLCNERKNNGSSVCNTDVSNG